MRTIDDQMDLIRRTKQIGLMTHVVAGYPSLKDCEELVVVMERVGADVVEIQIPFSDPIADGPTIMEANDKSLDNGVGVREVLDLVKRLRKRVKLPLLLMGYYQSLFSFGVNEFCRQAASVGVNGLIVPDVPLDERDGKRLLENCEANRLVCIRVLSPTSTAERVELNVKKAKGFVYCTAVAGTTGAREVLEMNIEGLVEQIKQMNNLPVAVGFGVSKPEHVKQLIGVADMVVVGSAVIREIEKVGVVGVERFIGRLVKAGE